MFENLTKKLDHEIIPSRPVSEELRKKFYSYPVAKILQDMGCNPFEIMAELAMNGETPRIKLDAATELAKYVAPQLKSIEFKGDTQTKFNLILNMNGNNDTLPESGETYEHGT